MRTAPSWTVGPLRAAPPHAAITDIAPHAGSRVIETAQAVGAATPAARTGRAESRVSFTREESGLCDGADLTPVMKSPDGPALHDPGSQRNTSTWSWLLGRLDSFRRFLRVKLRHRTAGTTDAREIDARTASCCRARVVMDKEREPARHVITVHRQDPKGRLVGALSDAGAHAVHYPTPFRPAMFAVPTRPRIPARSARGRRGVGRCRATTSQRRRGAAWPTRSGRDPELAGGVRRAASARISCAARASRRDDRRRRAGLRRASARRGLCQGRHARNRSGRGCWAGFADRARPEPDRGCAERRAGAPRQDRATDGRRQRGRARPGRRDHHLRADAARKVQGAGIRISWRRATVANPPPRQSWSSSLHLPGTRRSAADRSRLRRVRRGTLFLPSRRRASIRANARIASRNSQDRGA